MSLRSQKLFQKTLRKNLGKVSPPEKRSGFRVGKYGFNSHVNWHKEFTSGIHSCPARCSTIRTIRKIKHETEFTQSTIEYFLLPKTVAAKQHQQLNSLDLKHRIQPQHHEIHLAYSLRKEK